MVRTFGLPDTVSGTDTDIGLARAIIEAWRSDGVFRVPNDRWRSRRIEDAFEASRRFFTTPPDMKARCASDLSYSGYLLVPGGETFLIGPDLPLDDARVCAQWPCHGPVPWPDVDYRRAMRSCMTEFGQIGDTVLRLVALGLNMPETDWLTEDGWHHMHVRNFAVGVPQPRVDYGLLVITAQDLSSLTVSPGEIMHFLTDGLFRSVPRDLPGHTMAYLHEPTFDTGARPFVETSGFVHYGTHFTRTFMRTYPDRATTRRIVAEGRMSVLAGLSKRASVEA